MKASTLLVAASLVLGGSAFAQTYDSRTAAADKPPANVKSHGDAKEGVGTKLKKAMRRASEKTRQAFQRNDRPDARDTRQAGADTDTRTMGAPGADNGMNESDRARRARMDDAYGNWRNKQRP